MFDKLESNVFSINKKFNLTQALILILNKEFNQAKVFIENLNNVKIYP